MARSSGHLPICPMQGRALNTGMKIDARMAGRASDHQPQATFSDARLLCACGQASMSRTTIKTLGIIGEHEPMASHFRMSLTRFACCPLRAASLPSDIRMQLHKTADGRASLPATRGVLFRVRFRLSAE